jgi:glycosyltransferase involved in cell wall biosynthesis
MRPFANPTLAWKPRAKLVSDGSVTTWQGLPASTAVIVPFKDDFGSLARCLASALAGLPDGARLIVIDDGSCRDPSADPALGPIFTHPAVVILRHGRNRGPAAARNSGLDWCWENDVDTAILLDADCVAPADFVQRHLACHHAHPEALGVGGAIEGIGDGLWSRLDEILSWFTSVPRPDCEVDSPYHLPTTNLSLKLRPGCGQLLRFAERLRTGEDVALFRELRRAGEIVRFTSLPRIVHFDRTTFAAVLRHQYRWGLHTFVVRFGGDDATAALRLAFALGFILLAPAYAVLATWLNMRLWLAYRTHDWPFVPLVYLAYLVKAVAVVHGAIVPEIALYPDEAAARVAT